MKRIFLLLLICTMFTGAFSQQGAGNIPVRIDSISSSLNIEQAAGFYFDSTGKMPVEDIFTADFKSLNTIPSKNRLPRRYLTGTVYLKFTVLHAGPVSRMYAFYPGIHYNSIQIFKQENNGSLNKIEQDEEGTGFVHFNPPTGQPVTYLVELHLTKLDFNRMTAVLLRSSYLDNYLIELTSSYRERRIGSFVLSGILLMMILFTLVNYYLSKKAEFLYNSGFSTCMFLLIFFSSYLNKRPDWFSSLFWSYLSLMLLIVGTIFYLFFIRRFIDTKNKYPVLEKLFKLETWMLVVMMFIFTYVHFETGNIILGLILENAMKILALAVGIVFIVKGLKEKDKLIQYVALGSAAQIIFFIASLFIILTGLGKGSLLGSALFYFEIGVIMAVFFFLLGLEYKNRQELIEKTKEVEKKVFETQLAVIKGQQEERNRISADMHDDLGAGMTTIRLFSELAKTKMGDNVIPEIDKISTSADELLSKMNAIIWSMSSSNDTLGNTIAYIRSYALEYFDNTGITCRISLPDDLPDLEVPGTIRRNLFLVIKEAFNNIVKHSGASEVNIGLTKEDDLFTLLIHDNGRGINLEKLRQFGNGLRNMKKRMDDVQIEFSIENNNGTVVMLRRKIMLNNNMM